MNIVNSVAYYSHSLISAEKHAQQRIPLTRYLATPNRHAQNTLININSKNRAHQPRPLNTNNYYANCLRLEITFLEDLLP